MTLGEGWYVRDQAYPYYYRLYDEEPTLSAGGFWGPGHGRPSLKPFLGIELEPGEKVRKRLVG